MRQSVNCGNITVYSTKKDEAFKSEEILGPSISCNRNTYKSLEVIG